MSWADDMQAHRDGLELVLKLGREEIGLLQPDTRAVLEQHLAQVRAVFAANGVPVTADTRRAFLLGMACSNEELVSPKHVALLPCLASHATLLLGVGVGFHDGGR